MPAFCASAVPYTHQPVHGSNPVKPLRATQPRPLTSSHGHNHNHTAIPDLAGSCGYDALLDSGPGRTRRPARRAWRSGSRMILTDQRARQSRRGASSSTRWRKTAAHSSLAIRIGREHDRVCPKRWSRPPTITPARGIPGVAVRFVRSRADSSSAEQVVEARGERGSALVGPDRGVHAASTCRDARAPQIATSFAAIALRFSTRPTTRRDFLQSASHFHASHDVQILPNLPQN